MHAKEPSRNDRGKTVEPAQVVNMIDRAEGKSMCVYTGQREYIILSVSGSKGIVT